MKQNWRAGWKRARERHLHPFHWREAALGVPALVLLPAIGLWFGDIRPSVVAAGAAFVVGFGSARELGKRRWGAMIAVALGMPIAALVGTLAGQNDAIYIPLAALLAAGVAALALFDENLWWCTLQVVIGCFVAGFYHGPLAAALERTELVLAGGIAQLAIVWILAHLFPAARHPITHPAPLPPPERGLLIAHMVRAAVCVSAGLLVIAPLGLANGYWAPMTALLVLKPRLRDTGTRGLARLGGTLAGCVVATLYAMLCRDAPWMLIAGMAIAAGGAYALQKAHYASLTLSITATIVLLISLVDGAPLLNAEHRIAATLIGGALALTAAILTPSSLPRRAREADRVGG
jgi:uncharacterized membrane protein YgaE (UPF0421/DUF939 family)